MSNKIVPQTYRSVIDDVINNIRSEFDAYGVSEDVLGDLQTRWEAKIMASHVAEFESDPKQTQNADTPPSIPPIQPSFPPPPPPPHPSPYQHLYPPHPHHQYQNSGPLPPISVKTEPGVNEPRYPLTVGQAMHLQTFVLPHPPHPLQAPHSGQPGGNESVSQFQQQQRRGGGAPPWSEPSSTKGKARQGDLPRIPQLDGPSSTSSASSSTPPPGAGLSGPTSSKYIQLTILTLFHRPKKVARVKNKWKCVLKDGMVHVNGKDYLFAKCTG
ncbi:transcription factor IIA, alpha/beta subunit-domain-containing protein [Hysterangium stoloniferum]|nr:transcription factor IIA, alpha/beta subunit-domain-containing protein [Hysterangium stoloniferum]